MAGPLVTWMPAFISFATMWARVVLPRPGGAVEQEVVERLVASLGGLEEHAQVALQPLLADELAQALGPEGEFAVSRLFQRADLVSHRSGHRRPRVGR